MNDLKAIALIADAAEAAKGSAGRGRAGRRSGLLRALEPWFQQHRKAGRTWPEIAEKLNALPGYTENFGVVQSGPMLSTLRALAARHRKGRRLTTEQKIEEQVQTAVSKILRGLARAAEAPEEFGPPEWAEDPAYPGDQPTAAPAAAPAEPKPAITVPASAPAAPKALKTFGQKPAAGKLSTFVEPKDVMSDEEFSLIYKKPKE
jgi:hypothetical protein